jgi:2-C-methyl-D-erythritol 2,4-cyclodiphosphate synthase
MARAPPSPPGPQAKTHEKVDSIGEERSIGCHAVVMLIRKP